MVQVQALCCRAYEECCARTLFVLYRRCWRSKCQDCVSSSPLTLSYIFPFLYRVAQQLKILLVVLWLREAENSLLLASGKDLRLDFSLLVRRRVRNNESQGLRIRQAIRRTRDNLTLTIQYIVYSLVGSLYTYLLLWQIYLGASRLGR